MKKFTFIAHCLCLIGVCNSQSVAAQTKPNTNTPPIQIVAVGTVNFSQMAQQERLNPPQARNLIMGEIDGGFKTIPEPTNQKPNPYDNKTISPNGKGKGQGQFIASPSPLSSFSAIVDNGTIIPPDTHGAVGRTKIMTTLNTQYRIQDMSGTTLSTVTQNGFWNSVGDGSGGFDPKIFFDPYHSNGSGNAKGRWIIVACDDSQAATSGLLIGASQTEDPSGTWNLYKIDADAANVNWLDYPSVGFNKDWIVVGGNMFSISANAFVNSNIYVINKANVYNGAASPQIQLHTNTNGTPVPTVCYDPALSSMYLVQHIASNSGTGRFYTITGTLPATTLSGGTTLTSILGSWSTNPGSNNNFNPQTGSAVLINANDPRMQNAVYVNGNIWCTQTIFLPAGGSPTRAAVQWWRLSNTGAISDMGRIDDNDATAPQLFYAFPSIAVNRQNCAVVGYSAFSSTQAPSAAYSFRSNTDAAGTMQTPFIYKAGLATYTKDFGSGRVRWGDYSHAVLDPDNQSFWVIQEYAETPANTWSTYWANVASCVALPPLAVDLSDFNAYLNTKKNVSVNWITSSEINNDFFEIERSIDAKEFKTITKIKGNGTTNQKNEYKFIDANVNELSSKKIYYRLKQTDYDGSFTHSETKTIEIDFNTIVLKAFPNPTQGNLTVNIVAPTDTKNGSYEVIIYNTLGQVFFRQSLNSRLNFNQFSIQLPNVKGIYNVVVNYGKQTASQKIVLE